MPETDLTTLENKSKLKKHASKLLHLNSEKGEDLPPPAPSRFRAGDRGALSHSEQEQEGQEKEHRGGSRAGRGR